MRVDIVECNLVNVWLCPCAQLGRFSDTGNVPRINCVPTLLQNPMGSKKKDILWTGDQPAKRRVENIQRNQGCSLEGRRASQVMEVPDSPARSVDRFRR